MKETPQFKADLVQRSSIASAIFRRTGRKVTNTDVKKIARHLGFDSVEKGDHEHYYPKLQAIGIYDALMHKLEQMPAPAVPAPPAPQPCSASLQDYAPADLVAELRCRGYDVICTREVKTIEAL